MIAKIKSKKALEEEAFIIMIVEFLVLGIFFVFFVYFLPVYSKFIFPALSLFFGGYLYYVKDDSFFDEDKRRLIVGFFLLFLALSVISFSGIGFLDKSMESVVEVKTSFFS